jgi:hypothetical protein
MVADMEPVRSRSTLVKGSFFGHDAIIQDTCPIHFLSSQTQRASNQLLAVVDYEAERMATATDVDDPPSDTASIWHKQPAIETDTIVGIVGQVQVDDETSVFVKTRLQFQFNVAQPNLNFTINTEAVVVAAREIKVQSDLLEAYTGVGA